MLCITCIKFYIYFQIQNFCHLRMKVYVQSQIPRRIMLLFICDFVEALKISNRDTKQKAVPLLPVKYD